MSSGTAAFGGIRFHLSLPSCPQTAAPAGLRLRLPILWVRPKTERNAAAADGSGRLTWGRCARGPDEPAASASARPLGAAPPALARAPPGVDPSGMRVPVTSRTWERDPSFQAPRPARRQSRRSLAGPGACAQLPRGLLVSPGNRRLRGLGRQAPGVEVRPAEISPMEFGEAPTPSGTRFPEVPWWGHGGRRPTGAPGVLRAVSPLHRQLHP